MLKCILPLYTFSRIFQKRELRDNMSIVKIVYVHSIDTKTENFIHLNNGTRSFFVYRLQFIVLIRVDPLVIRFFSYEFTNRLNSKPPLVIDIPYQQRKPEAE